MPLNEICRQVFFGESGQHLGEIEFTCTPGTIASHAFICTECGEVYGRRCFVPPAGTKDYSSRWVSHERRCLTHSGGSVALDGENLETLPRAVQEIEILAFNPGVV